jgi:uncharacterized protein
VNEKLPSRENAIKLLYGVGCSQNVVHHCIAVAELAVKIVKLASKKGVKVNQKLVEIGALLHDIGRAKTHTVHHAITGAELAKKYGLSESIIRIIKRHVGGGISPQEAEKLGWPNDIYVPQTMEEKIVSYADKLIEGAKRVSIQHTITKMSKKIPEDAVKRMWKLHEEIMNIIGNLEC